MQEVKRIVVLGPESTGKSTLCKELARHYKTLWCEEYAREYLIVHGTNYSYDDLLVIAKGQVKKEEEYIEIMMRKEMLVSDELSLLRNAEDVGQPSTGVNNHLLFIDTNMYVMKVWCEFVFGKCHQYILDQLKIRKYDLYLLCNTDLPWVKDQLREYPDLETRDKLYNIYKDIMTNQEVPWVDITGTQNQRKEVATSAVHALLTTIR